MHSTTGRARWAIATGLATLYLLWALLRPQLLSAPGHAALPYFIARSILFIYVLLFVRLTLAAVARFRPPADDTAHDRVVYHYGAWGWGLAYATLMSAMIAARQSGPFSASWDNLERLLFHFCFVFVVALPLGLWGGYFWGSAMAWVFGVQKR